MNFLWFSWFLSIFTRTLAIFLSQEVPLEVVYGHANWHHQANPVLGKCQCWLLHSTISGSSNEAANVLFGTSLGSWDHQKSDPNACEPFGWLVDIFRCLIDSDRQRYASFCERMIMNWPKSLGQANPGSKKSRIFLQLWIWSFGAANT